VVEIDEVTAREEILARIAESLRDVPADERPEDVAVPRAYRRTEPGDAVERFIERVSEYKTTVRRVSAARIATTIAERCQERGASSLAVARDLPAAWAPEGIELVREDTFETEALDAVDGALTGCALAIAETGTIVFDRGPAQGRRALTLVPEYHLCVVGEDQIVGGVPEAMALIARTLRGGGRPITFVSGPSATADIEFSRVEGVHGPRVLDVLVAGR
jgi:L-lactate dehydrogenase complex protein LldG